MSKTFLVPIGIIITLVVAWVVYQQYRTYTCYDLSGQPYESDIDCTDWQT